MMRGVMPRLIKTFEDCPIGAHKPSEVAGTPAAARVCITAGYDEKTSYRICPERLKTAGHHD